MHNYACCCNIMLGTMPDSCMYIYIYAIEALALLTMELVHKVHHLSLDFTETATAVHVSNG